MGTIHGRGENNSIRSPTQSRRLAPGLQPLTRVPVAAHDPILANAPDNGVTLIDALLAEQQTLSAVDRFARARQQQKLPGEERHYRRLLPASSPKPGQQYAFEVDLDRCSGCKSCVSACHSLNGLDETETWRSVGLLVSHSPTKAHPTRSDSPTPRVPPSAFQQHVTTACHHCADPGCLNGCPVLAYEKEPFTGIVRHLDDQCMGCSYCIMKCPYEVPQYSRRLGIVRKCDLCANRLAVGEAPACVQACPDEAIKITLVEHDQALGHRASATNHFLPGSPNPALTLPTTRYLSARGLPGNLVAADHAAPRLDHPHRPLVLMLVLTQASAGLLLASAVLNPVVRIATLPICGFILLVVGMLAATLHLGRPLKAWRAFLGWRTSWLSRELIAFNAFASASALAILHPPFSLLAAITGLAAVFTSGMVYVDTGRPFWGVRRTFGSFFGTTLLLGATFTAVIIAWNGAPAPYVQATSFVALTIRTALFTWRRLELLVAHRNPTSPIHLNARIICERLPNTTALRTALFVASTIFGVLAIGNVARLAPLWASAAAVTTFSSEIVGRHVFFAAGASQRMPGGIPA